MIVSINKLEGLKEASPSYVLEQLASRKEDIKHLPEEVYKLIKNNRGKLLDIGPGEGVSSMALANEFEHLKIIGLEMDQKHLTGAWPECNKYHNLELYFGALPGTPSNGKVDGDIVVPKYDGVGNILFTWTGMSRVDIFVNNGVWRDSVSDTCIFIVPKFWREGLDSLGEGKKMLEDLISKAGGEMVQWKPCTKINGFDEMKVYPLKQKLKARGWILWLSGLFDHMDVSFWNTLTDRWKDDPSYQLSDLELDLEAIVVSK